MNPEFVSDIYEGFITYMNVDERFDSHLHVSIRNIYQEMRTILLTQNTNSADTIARLVDLKQQAEDFEIMLENSITHSEMTLEELATPKTDDDCWSEDDATYGEHCRRLRNMNPDMSEEEIKNMVDEEMADAEEAKTNPSPNINYCGKSYPTLSWKKYATLQLKIIYDSDYQNAFIEKKNMAEIEAQRREIDSRIKRMTIHGDLYNAMYCCANCFKVLSDKELDEKAMDMYYENFEAWHGYSCVCGDCHAIEEQHRLDDSVSVHGYA